MGCKVANSTSFKPGQIGNPRGGRRVTISDRIIRDMCKAHGPKAIETLFDLLENSKNPRDRIACAEILLDRGFGRAAQAVTISGDPDSPIKHELIAGPRQETLLEWQQRRQNLLDNVTVKVLENDKKN